MSVPGLDVALGGGLIKGKTYLLKGAPGTGKTVLASHYCCDAAGRGDNSLYVTLLAETHADLLENLRTFSFFDEAKAKKHITFASGYSAIMDGGLECLAKLLRDEVRSRRCRLLVIDSLNLAIERESRSETVKRFMRDLGTYCSMLGCTVIHIATSSGVVGKYYFIETIVDGIIEVADDTRDLRALRTLQVVKLRGSSHLEGKHYFAITRDGAVVHPRTEARVAQTEKTREAALERIPFGIDELDRMLGGGLTAGSSTAVLGPPGSGKTVLGMQFLDAGARRDEPGLYFGFFETPPRLLEKARGVGLPISSHAKHKRVEVLWRPPLENSIDEIAEIILEAVHRSGARRVFIDGIDAFRICSAFPERLPRFFAALTNELRRLGATSLFAKEIELFSSRVRMTDETITAFFDNLLLLRYVEEGRHFRRRFSILKVRESDYDDTIRELSITRRGIELASSTEVAGEDSDRPSRAPAPPSALARRDRRRR